MGLFSHNGLLMMLLFHLCQAQDAALPSPESAPPSLDDVINAVKVAFEQAMQISTEGTVHKTLEQAAEELAPWKTPTEQPPAAENVADHTTEAADVVRVSEEEASVVTAGEPDAHMSESNEQTDEESVQGQAEDVGLPQDTDEEPARPRAQESFQETSDSESVKITKESVESGIEIAQSVQELVKSGVESDLQGPHIAEEAGTITEYFAEGTKTEESPVHAFTADTQNESETGRAVSEINGGGKEVVKTAGEPEEEFAKEEVWKPHVSEIEKIAEKEKDEVAIGGGEVKLEGLQEDEHVNKQPGAVEKTEEETESQLSQEERQAGATEEGTDGGVMVETGEQLEEDQGVEEVRGAFIETEGENVEAETELHTFLGGEEVLPTRKTPVPVETQREPEVTVDTKGPIKLQKPVIMKSESTGGTTHEVNDVNEIITSRDMTENDHDGPALINTVEELPPAPTLGLGLRDSEEPAEEPDDPTNSKALGQEAWKIGAIAAAFFLILQTAVTVVYILKCRRKPNSTAAPKKVCARGNGGIEYDASNTDTTIPMDEETGVDDLPEYSQVQQEVEDVAMTTTPPDSTEQNSSHDLRTSVV